MARHDQAGAELARRRRRGGPGASRRPRRRARVGTSAAATSGIAVPACGTLISKRPVPRCRCGWRRSRVRASPAPHHGAAMPEVSRGRRARGPARCRRRHRGRPRRSGWRRLVAVRPAASPR
ncbi:MAG: hypothetical protein MZW92_33490 [Comamonadaceae bacterium]|nr:hypothetical protein [Comamonadaceae bacterium]